jgi:hypothetical protein
MALIGITLDLSRIASALEQIAASVDAIYSWLRDPAAEKRERARETVLSEPGDLGQISDESLWQREQDEERLADRGLPPRPSVFPRH